MKAALDLKHLPEQLGLTLLDTGLLLAPTVKAGKCPHHLPPAPHCPLAVAELLVWSLLNDLQLKHIRLAGICYLNELIFAGTA